MTKSTFLQKTRRWAQWMLLAAALLASVATQAQQQQSLTVCDGGYAYSTIPAYLDAWNMHPRSQCVFPAYWLSAMNGATITQLSFYFYIDEDAVNNVEDLSPADVYLKEVNQTGIHHFEATSSATIVYHGPFHSWTDENGNNILTIEFTTPYVYHGGNLLLGIDAPISGNNRTAPIYFIGLMYQVASIYCAGSDTPEQQDFLPKTTFTYTTSSEPSCPSGFVCIGGGSSSDRYFPFNCYWNYSLTEQIYTADEIGDNVSTISGVSFYSLGNVTRNLDIYMENTTKSSFNGSSDWIATDVENRVFSGAVTFTANDWTTITFDDNFSYSGNNIVLIVDDNTGSYVDYVPFRAFSGEGTQSKYIYSDDINFNPATPPNDGTMSSVKNCVRFATGGDIPGDECAAPVGLQATDVSVDGAAIEWNDDNDYAGYNVRYRPVADDPENEWTVVEDVPAEIGLDNLLPGTTYEWQVQGISYQCEGGVTDWSEISTFQTAEPEEVYTEETACNQFQLYNGDGELIATFTQSGLYEAIYNNGEGWIHLHLNLTIVDHWGGVTEVASCIPYTWVVNGRTYNKGGRKVYNGTDDEGCPIRDTLELSIVEHYGGNTDVTSCGPYYWSSAGRTYNKGGRKVFTGSAEDGCDIRDTLNLTIVDHWGSNTFVTSCGPFYWDVADRTYNKGGKKSYTGTAVDGCPIRDTLTLTIVDHYGSNLVVSSCGPYTWAANGKTYNKGGKKTNTGTAVDGCPIRDTLTLTVNAIHANHEYVTNCGPYTWAVNGKTYNKSGVKTNKGTTPEGCPAYDTLTLTVNASPVGHTEVTNCGPYTWATNGKTYNKGGVKTYKGTTAQGCPIRDTLILTIVDKWVSYTSDTNCGPYTWAVNGRTYNKGGIKTNKGVAADGCPKYDTLNLTIVDKWTSYIYDINCGPYTWDVNGKTYNKGGIKTNKGVAADGCPKYDTLNLTIVDRWTSHEYVTNCGPYTWAVNGKTYNKSGVKTSKGTAADGCPTYDTLTLTITNCKGNSEANSQLSTLNSQLSLYPNPTTGLVHIDVKSNSQLSTLNSQLQVEVLDLVGRRVAVFENTADLDLTGLAAGTYTLRITMPDGVVIRKVVKK